VKGRAAVLDCIRKWIRPGWRATAVASFFSGGLRLIRPRRKVALENLRLAFPDSEETWRKETVRKCYLHISWMVAEYLSLVSDPARVHSWVVETEGKEILDNLRDSGRGAIILTGHVGNWELLAGWLAQSGYPLTAVVRNPDDPNLSELIETYRAALGVGTIEKHFIMKDAVRFAKRGGFLGLLPDQAWNSTGVHGPFFGRMCYTAGGPAAIAHMAGVPVVPVVSYRLAPFRHRVVISPPVPMAEGTDRNSAIQENTLRMNRAIEEMIRPFPEQWLWLHRRWK
jgi:KDO2-lipid IV(A) lauroyltransferase